MNNPFNNLLISKSAIIDLTLTSITNGDELLLTYFNQHSFNTRYENNNFQIILEHKFQYYLDGIGVWAANKLFNNARIKRFNASEINQVLFDEFVQKEIPLILIGGNFTRSILNTKRLNVELYLNGYKDLDDFENLLITIAKTKIKTIVIGLGTPKQEEFAYKLSQKILGLQIICVGNFLEFYFGTIKRAPIILHNSGFEWLFRLITEPKRLWKRYLLGIPIFVFRLIKIKLTK